MSRITLTMVVSILAAAMVASGGAPSGVGDPEIGEEIYRTNLEDEPGRHACSECHSLGQSGPFGPSFQGISEIAGERVAGMTAEEYLRESIANPSAFIVEGYHDNLMPKVYGEILSEEEINHLIAFMLSQ